ncbi:MAG: hypothetical protein ACRDZ4_07140 [Egibacteraceae bacterium]
MRPGARRPLIVADSALGYLRDLCALARAKVEFVAPLRADAGWAGQFDRDVGALGGLDRLADLDHTAQREQSLPAEQRTRWTGLLRAWQVTDPATKTVCDLRVAYIWSSEEAASVADARQRALVKAETSLGEVRNGLGGRYYKTKKQVDDRVARILGKHVAGLLSVTTGETRPANPPSTGTATPTRSPTPAASTGCTPWRPTWPTPKAAGSPHSTCWASTKTNGSSSNATATSNKPCGYAQCSYTTTTASTRSPQSSASPYSSSGCSKPTCAPDSASSRSCPGCSQKAAPPNPPAVTSSPPSQVSP